MLSNKSYAMANTKIALPIRNEYLENGEKKTNRKTPSVYSQKSETDNTVTLFLLLFDLQAICYKAFS